MALKRSGVRASSAPYRMAQRFIAAPFCILQRGWLPGKLLGSTFLGSFLLLGRSDAQTTNSTHPPTHSAAKVTQAKRVAEDAEIFVRPLSQDGAFIGIAYQSKVAHSIAQADVAHLLQAGGWQLTSPLQISDESLQPDRPKKFPPATGVFFSVTHAPQVLSNAPNLLPYLHAFQRLNQFELAFEMDALTSYAGVTRVENSVVSIQMTHNVGLYSYEITVHNHKENIPALVNNGEAIDNTRDEARSVANVSEAGQDHTRLTLHVKPPNMILIMALALGAGALVGGSIYLLMSRQSAR